MQVTPSVRLVGPLGAGGMGAVWIADHLTLHVRVVVKFISAELAANDDARMRFSREAASAAAVKSPHVVQMLDHGVVDGAPFIVMELLEGEDLRHRIERERILPLQDLDAILTQACKALGQAHRAGIVHRDIKPDNIFLCRTHEGETFVKLLDFGIAKRADATLDSMGATKTGAVMGTPYYMSPEQALGAKGVDFRTDLWSLGVVVFEAMTGARAFDGDTIGALAVAITHGPMPAPSRVNAALPRAIDDWFARACARDVAHRFGSAKEMADAFSVVINAAPGAPSLRVSGPQQVAPNPAMAHGFDTTTSPISQPDEAGPLIPKTRLMPLALGGLAVVVVVVALIGARSVAAKRTIEQTHADFVRCLVGDLGKGESASVRFHEIQLAANPVSREDPSGPWPVRCSARADALAQALQGEHGAEGLVQATTTLGRMLSSRASLMAVTDISEPIDAFFRESEGAKIGAGVRSDVVPPPAPVKAPTIDTLDPARAMFAKPFSIERMFVSPFVDAALTFVVDDPALGSAFVCSWSPTSEAIRCRKVEGPAALMSPGLRPWGTTAANVPPFLFAGVRGKDGVFRSDTGARVVENLSFDGAYGASARAPGVLDFLVWQHGTPEMLLRHIQPDGRVADTTALDRENVGYPFYSTALLWDWFAYRASANGEIHLFMRHLGDGGGLGPVEDAGWIPEVGTTEAGEPSTAHVTGCRAAKLLALRSRGYTHQYVSLLIDGHWSAPVAADGTEGTLTCAGSEATLTSVNDWQIVRSRCSVSGCMAESTKLASLGEVGLDRAPRSAKDVVAVDLGTRIAVVWYAGVASGLRERVGSVQDLEHADDVVLLDDHVRNGQFSRDSTYRAIRSMTTSSGALLFVQTVTGVFPYRFDSEGKLVLVPVRY